MSERVSKRKRRGEGLFVSDQSKEITVEGQCKGMWETHGEGHNHHTLTFGPFCRAFLPVGDVLKMKRARWVMFRGSGEEK